MLILVAFLVPIASMARGQYVATISPESVPLATRGKRKLKSPEIKTNKLINNLQKHGVNLKSLNAHSSAYKPLVRKAPQVKILARR